MRAGWLAAGLIAVCAVPAAADRVLLKNGFTLEGTAVTQGDQVVVRLATGSVTVPRSQVAEIVAAETPLDAFTRQRAEVAEDDLDGRVALGHVAVARGLHTTARDEWKAVLSRDPDHAGARAALGYVRHGDAWVTPDEQKALLGLVREGRAWVNPEQARLRQDDRRLDLDAARAVAEREVLAAEAERLRAEATRLTAEAEAIAGSRARAEAAAYSPVVMLHGGRGHHAVDAPARRLPGNHVCRSPHRHLGGRVYADDAYDAHGPARALIADTERRVQAGARGGNAVGVDLDLTFRVGGAARCR